MVRHNPRGTEARALGRHRPAPFQAARISCPKNGLAARFSAPAGWLRVFFVASLAYLWSGCRAENPGSAAWPAPARVLKRDAETYLGYDFDHDGRLDYLQRLKDGYKDRLYFPVTPKGAPKEIVSRPAADPKTRPLLVLLLDGVAYSRVEALRERGAFRLFRRPARVVSTFPSLTDVAYDAFFRTGPTPGYEAGYFDRAANRLTNGVQVYLSGANEKWERLADYRMSTLRDAFMYLFPKSTFRAELGTARKRLDACFAAGQRVAVIYCLSTDGLGHMLAPPELEEFLGALDGWLERLMYDCRGELEIAVLADHGNTVTPPRRFLIQDVLRAAGLQVRDRLERPGDVAVPLFGLLDIARVHTYDAATRDRVMEALAKRPEVELIVWPDGREVGILAENGRARVSMREQADGPRYKYEPLAGDPLRYQDVVVALRAANALDADGYAPASAWLAASVDHEYPAAPPRLWEGLYLLSNERPDVAVCLRDGWYVGSGFLASFVKMQGTHGSLRRPASETFVMATGFEVPSPIRLADVYDVLVRQLNWRPHLREEAEK